MTYKLNNREVEITETDHDDGIVMVLGAVFLDDGAELTEAECLELEEIYADELAQDHYEDQCAAAYDRAKDFYKYGE